MTSASIRTRRIAALGVAAILAACFGDPALAQAPSVGSAAAPPLEVPYVQFTLPNGLNVILHEDHTVPMVSVNVRYHVGSGHEKPGRTGFAHLFEHLMFEGSGHVKEGDFDNLLEAAGGDNNGSTDGDRTNYWINVPSNALELALYLDSDRMAYLVDAMSPDKVNGQRDVVKNERRQSYENQPYGMASIAIDEMLYPAGHPYHWPTIGYMEDLTAASFDDTVEFFRTYYAPNNASLSIAGDIDLASTRVMVEKWFGEIKRGVTVPPLAPPAAWLAGLKQKTLTDKVQLPRLHLAWVTPAAFAPADAALDAVAGVLAGGKNSRLFKRLVYDLQIAQDVEAVQQSQALASTFMIVATARPGHTADEIRTIVDEEIDLLRSAPPSRRELDRVVNQAEASFFARMERSGGFGGKADQLNAYHHQTGDPDYFAEDLARYRALSPSDVQAAVVAWLPKSRRVDVVVVPESK